MKPPWMLGPGLAGLALVEPSRMLRGRWRAVLSAGRDGVIVLVVENCSEPVELSATDVKPSVAANVRGILGGAAKKYYRCAEAGAD